MSSPKLGHNDRVRVCIGVGRCQAKSMVQASILLIVRCMTFVHLHSQHSAWKSVHNSVFHPYTHLNTTHIWHTPHCVQTTTCILCLMFDNTAWCQAPVKPNFMSQLQVWQERTVHWQTFCCRIEYKRRLNHAREQNWRDDHVHMKRNLFDDTLEKPPSRVVVTMPYATSAGKLFWWLLAMRAIFEALLLSSTVRVWRRVASHATVNQCRLQSPCILCIAVWVSLQVVILLLLSPLLRCNCMIRQLCWLCKLTCKAFVSASKAWQHILAIRPPDAMGGFYEWQNSTAKLAESRASGRSFQHKPWAGFSGQRSCPSTCTHQIPISILLKIRCSCPNHLWMPCIYVHLMCMLASAASSSSHIY